MIAAAATISVVYPHMNSIGGDGFWLISKAGEAPIAIDAAGVALVSAHRRRYGPALPTRGPGACITLPGTVAGWQLARNLAPQLSRRKSVPLKELFSPAIEYAEQGVPVSASLKAASQKIQKDILNFDKPDVFASLNETYLDPVLKQSAESVKNPALATTFDQLARRGLEDFYSGELAQNIVNAAAALRVDISSDELAVYKAVQCEPLTTPLSLAQLYNLPAPTQGLASLVILALFDRLYQKNMDEEALVHCLVEATKQAFILRDNMLADPEITQGAEKQLLEAGYLDALAKKISQQALPWPQSGPPGDTVWMGCVDQDGLMVSFIQSLYWEFGSGLLLKDSGIIWNNRGSSFSLDPEHPNVIAPGKKPLHTLNPAYAAFEDGRRLVYGCMGGEGQPQTQAALFSRYAYLEQSLATAIANDRWLLGRTWGESSTDLKLEPGLGLRIADGLRARGHEVNVLHKVSETMGHAGGICLLPNGEIECANDPRSDGLAVSNHI